MTAKKIGICAPSTPFSRECAEKITAIAAERHPDAELIFDDQCFAEHGHFAGSDALRLETFVRMANDPALDAIWFARGGYGAARIAEEAVAKLGNAARGKAYMGYSDAGNLLGALYHAGIGQCVHGPMPTDISRNDGKKAVIRALGWLVADEKSALEDQMQPEQKYVAFNLMTLTMMAGTPLMPNLKDHILMVEEIGEYLYAVDRAMFNLTSQLSDAGLTGIMLGRISGVPENDRPFGETTEEIAIRWCKRHQIAYLGRADIGHDINNKIVPFGKTA